MGAWVICEPRFNGSREISGLWKNVNPNQIHITSETSLCEPKKIGSHQKRKVHISSLHIPNKEENSFIWTLQTLKKL